MTVFSPENTAKAIRRVPSTGTKDLRSLLLRARHQKLFELATAIENELSLRGPISLDAPAAQRHCAWAEQVVDLNLVGAIEVAFTLAPINEDERALAMEIARLPGVSYQGLTKLRGKGDVSLILGHMVYERLGFFRKFIEGTERISDLLFVREELSGRVTYSLTHEAEQAWRTLRLI